MRNRELLTKKGFTYMFDPDACETCNGRCCNGESGNIHLNRKEIGIISNYLKIDSTTFILDYLRKDSYRLSLKEIKIGCDNFSCIFFNHEINSCDIYPVRPKQCRTFPFWEYFKDRQDELKEECQGVVFVEPKGQ